MGLPKVTAFAAALLLALPVREQMRYEMTRRNIYQNYPTYPMPRWGKSGVARAKHLARKQRNRRK